MSNPAGNPVRISEAWDNGRLVYASVTVGTPPAKREERWLRDFLARFLIAYAIWLPARLINDIDMFTDFPAGLLAMLGSVSLANLALHWLRRLTAVERFFTREAKP